MKWSTLQPLAVPLLAAIALHGLWLAGQRLPRQPATASAVRAPLADDTPELVRLARRLTLEQSLRVATPLPPPPAPPAPPAPPTLPGPQPMSRASQPSTAAKARPKAPKVAAAQPASRVQRRAAKPTAGTSTVVSAGASGPPARLLSGLWAKAQPVEDVAGPLATLPASVQLRQIGEEQARRLGLSDPPASPQVLGGDLLVVWLQGGEVWLLRLPLPKPVP
ncbi:MAG: hypothetical protein VKN13_02165 [Cyanobacteriota bacterium]|nr:hypothetical protein [Cyanobacteriota bacterium]